MNNTSQNTHGLAPYAAQARASRGRLHDQPASATRSPFQRDRDRILHSTAFRRLTYKTQVFVYHEGDHYRSRLTHSLEVAQIARSIARTLCLDEDLAEAIALAHDLGHTPFGHAGEEALNAVMKDYGGFDHNAQSLRIVTDLERKYASFDGLNLTWEALEGLVKHNGPLLDETGRADKGAGVPQPITDYCAHHDLELASHASAEAQAAALADDIAYNNHDIDDGFRAGLCRLEDLKDVSLTSEAIRQIDELYPNLEDGRLIYEVSRRLITAMVDDTIVETQRRIEMSKPESYADVRALGRSLVSFSTEMSTQCNELHDYLYSQVYRNERVMRVMGDAQRIVSELFELYMRDPAALPPAWRKEGDREDKPRFARKVCDFIAGMTDRFAHNEHRRLFDDTPELR